MFGLGFGELVIVAILALVLLGPDQLPDAARTIGKTIRDLKKATDGLKGQIEAEMYSVEKGIEKLIDAPDVPPVAAAAAARTAPQPAAPLPATAENVPGLDAALIDPASPPLPPPPPAGEPPKTA
jgi:sec-independent protein translocase protein TatB